MSGLLRESGRSPEEEGTETQPYFPQSEIERPAEVLKKKELKQARACISGVRSVRPKS